MNTTSPPPTVSVVTPCYNGSPYLREALDSALAQSRPPVEIIVVDDGSTDDSAAIAESYGPPVRVIRQKNQGESVARNVGIDAARGDWIGYLDADDVWNADKLEKQVALIEPGVVCVHARYYNFGLRTGDSQRHLLPPNERYTLPGLVAANPFCMSSLLVRRDSKARFPVWTRWGEDRLYMMDVVREGSVRCVDEPLLGNRRASSNQTSNPKTQVRRHQGLLRWLDERQDELDSETITAIRANALKKLVNATRGARSRREWDNFEALRAYLEELKDHPDVAQVVGEFTWPRWMYATKDRLRSLVLAKPGKR